MRYQLSRSIAFLLIKGAGLNGYRYTLPFFTTAALALLYAGLDYLNVHVSLQEIGQKFLAAFAILPGFFLASLAAVSTFQSEMLDRTVEGSGVRAKLKSQGEFIEEKITYRIFFGYMFSYLSVASFIVLFVLAASPSISSSIMKILPDNHGWLFVFGSFMISLAIVHVISITLQAIYFLSERMHRPSA